MWVVKTTDGHLSAADYLPHDAEEGERKEFTEERAKVNADFKNRRAEALGLNVRYEAVETFGL